LSDSIEDVVFRMANRATIDLNQAAQARAEGHVERFRFNIKDVIEQLGEMLKL